MKVSKIYDFDKAEKLFEGGDIIQGRVLIISKYGSFLGKEFSLWAY